VKSSSIGRRYAKALLELADAENQTPRVAKDLAAFVEVWGASSELRDMFHNPAVDRAQRSALLEAIAEKMSMVPLLRSTLGLLSDRGRLWAVLDVAEAFQEMAEDREGVVRVEVTTASAMTDAYFTQLQTTLGSATSQKVVLVKKQDPSLIAGVVTRMGDLVFDGSLRSHLEELKAELLSK